jgi:hypothetical protein
VPRKISKAAKAPPKDAKVMVNYRIKASILAALAEAAKDDGRSGTGMIEKILSDWLKTNEYLK